MQYGKKLCAFLMALCLIVGFIPASVFAAESKTEVVGQQLYLGDDLTMHFYVSITDAHKADGVMNIAVGSNSVDYDIHTMTANEEGNYVFSVKLGAPQMTDDITLTLTSGGEQVLQNVYSIQDYAHYLLENNYTSETKALVKEMLNYGAKAQLYFDYNTTDLANAGYEIASTAVIGADAPTVAVSGAVDGIKFYGSSMTFESKIAIRYYFTTSDSIDGYSFTVDGERAEPNFKNDMYYIEIDGISPDAMDTLRTVKVAKDDAELTVQYSPVYYITRMYNKASTSQTLKDLLLAAKGYFDAAKVFTGVAKNTLTIGTARSDISKAKTLYFTTNLTHGLDLYTDVTSVSNEETHILINGQAWNGQELCVFEKNVFYVNNIAAAEGTQLTIKEGFSIALHGENYVTEQEYNFWWINGSWVTAKDTLKITTLGSGDASILFFRINTTTGVSDWADIASKCNEESHILINDQAWSTQEIGGISGKEFYVNKIGAAAGTKLTVKAGFTAVFGGVAYTTDRDYNYWWTGSEWTATEPVQEKTLTIGASTTASNAKTLYFATDYTHGMSLYANVTGYANEETHILVNGQAWNGYELCAFENNIFYINNIGAAEGTAITIKEGFTIQRNGVKYVTAQDYNFWWINGTWVTARDTLKITTLGSGDATILFFHTNTATGVSDWANIAKKCNEETHILINGEAWSTQEIGGISGKEFYVNKIGATEGTKITIKAGFTAIFSGVAYTTDQDYNYWWTGTEWTATEPIPEKPLAIGAVQSYSNAKTLYFATDYTHGMTLYASATGYANEETHILVNGEAWNGYELCAFEGNVFYINNIGATEGTTVTIKEGFTIHRNGVKYVTAQDYNFWWINGTWVTARDTLKITTLGSGDATILFFHTNTTTGVSDWANIAKKCNEETHILINGEAWSTQEIGGISGKEFYVNKIGATEGTKLTIKAGFTAIFGGVAYTTDQDYNYWWTGSEWTATEPVQKKTLTIGSATTASNAKTLYFATDYTHGMSLYADVTRYANEETHILVNGQAWNGFELCAFENNVFYVNKINAAEGTTVTIQAGFTIHRNGVDYVTNQDYVFTWTGARWASEVKTLTIGTAQSYSTYNALYFATDLTHGKSNYADATGYSNEETHIFVNGQPWNGYELCAFDKTVFYVNKIGAAVGTQLTITEGFAITINGIAYITDQEYNYWWNGSAWTADYETLSITALGTGTKDILYFRINTTTGVSDWANIAGKCNEETHILINGEAWSTQELGGISGKEFYVNKIGATKGTNLTIQKGFVAVFNGTIYVTERDYSFTFNGSNWTIDLPLAEKVLTIGAAQSYSTYNALYFATDYTHGMSLYADATGYANEETHILVNGEAWNGYELCAFEGNVFYVNKIGATEGTTVTIKEGFTITRKGIVYTTEQDYAYKWNGSAWVDVSFVAPEGIWNEIPLGVFGSPYNSQQAYNECADAGFNFALIDQNYAAIGTTSYKAILNYCVQAGINPISMTFGTNDTTDYSDVPGYAGKFYFDEPGTSEFASIAAMVGDFEAQGYKNGIFLNNLLPSYASKLTLEAFTYETYLDKYVTQVLSKVSGPKWLSVDFYPLWANASGDTKVHTNYLYNLEATAQTALKYKDMDLTVHYFVQTHGHGNEEWNVRNLSSVADIRYQYNCAMAYGVNAFSVFAYPTQKGDVFENGNGLVTINADGTTTKNESYYYVQQANNELKAWDEIYLSYDYEGTMAIGKSTSGQSMVNKLSKNLTSLSGASVVNASNDTLIGQFDKNGSKAYMVANYSDPSNDEMDTVILNFAEGTALQVIINGVVEETTVSNGRLVLSLDAGEAAFVIVK